MNNKNEWKVFDWDYEKKFYDVRLKDGTIIKNCLPNAGYMNRNDGIDGKYQTGSCEIRESENQMPGFNK